MSWFFYIIECSDTSLYCGITNDLDRRIEEHKNGVGGKYTRSRLPIELRHFERFASKGEALRRESEVRRWSRKKKRTLF